MHLPSSPWLWLLRRATGFRLRHVLAAAVMLAVVLVGVSMAFWVLGEQADAAIGLAGVFLVAVAYLAVAPVLLMLTTTLIGGLVLARLRRRARLLGFGGLGTIPGSARPVRVSFQRRRSGVPFLR